MIRRLDQLMFHRNYTTESIGSHYPKAEPLGGWGLRFRAVGVGKALTVQIQQGVEDFALNLPGALRHAGHPQPLVDGLGRHDVVPRVGVNLPLGQCGADNGADPAQEGQDET